MTDFEALPSRFPLLNETTYLNSGSYAALADSICAAFLAYLDDRLAIGANWDVLGQEERGGAAWPRDNPARARWRNCRDDINHCRGQRRCKCAQTRG